MRIYHSLPEVPDPSAAGRVVAIGVFDGVHRGHQEILRRAVEAARSSGASSAAVTFYPHPDAVLHRRSAPPMLTPLARKAELLEELGMQELVVVPFDKDFAQLTPASFCSAVLSDHLGARAVFVGENFRFGHLGAGTPADLLLYGQSHGFEVVAVGLARDSGEVISSTRIRELLREGRVAEAAGLLGRPHRIEGTVISGSGAGQGPRRPDRQHRSHERHGASPFGHLHDPFYRGRERSRIARSPASARTPHSRATARSASRRCCSTIPGSCTGPNLAVDFLARIRDQQAFPDAETLAARIKEDVAIARGYTAEEAG